MKNGFKDLEGNRVKAVKADDGIHFRFFNGATLSVFNSVAWSGPAQQSISSVLGKRLNRSHEFENGVELFFDEGSRLSIDLSDLGYSGPEAIVLRVPGKATVVWN